MEKKRKRLTKEERKKQILEHTAKLVASKGFKSVSIRDIARSADINEALIYKHFSSKDELLIEMYKEFLNRKPKCPPIPTDENEFIQILSNLEDLILKKNMEEPNILKTILYVTLDEYKLPSEFNMNKEGTYLNWLNECINIGKKKWGFDNSILNEAYISLYMGSMIYFTLQSSITGIFNVEKDNINGSFTKMFIKALKK